MEPYTAFSNVYDSVFKHVDYNQWYLYIRSIMLKYIEIPKRILEIGCGTGKFGAKFSHDDFEIYGLDKSIDMLKVAKLRAYNNFRIICGDMINFHFAKNFDFIFCVHDTINYLLLPNEINQVLGSVKGLMTEKSIFMFDITSEYNVIKNFHGKVKKYHVNGIKIEWSNDYEKNKNLIYSTLKFQDKNGLAVTETHIQRVYSIEEMISIIKANDFKIIDILGDYTFSPVKKNSVMINFITKRIY